MYQWPPGKRGRDKRGLCLLEGMLLKHALGHAGHEGLRPITHFAVFNREEVDDIGRVGTLPPLLMDNILSWNVRGLNAPNKQEDVKNFLHKHGVKLVALLETKMKKENVNQIASRVFVGWQWYTNAEIVPKVRVWVAWQEATFQVHVIHVTDQLTHCMAKLADSTNAFSITFVYGLNTVAGR